MTTQRAAPDVPNAVTGTGAPPTEPEPAKVRVTFRIDPDHVDKIDQLAERVANYMAATPYPRRDKTNKTISIDADLHAWLKAEAERVGMTLNMFVSRLMMDKRLAPQPRVALGLNGDTDETPKIKGRVTFVDSEGKEVDLSPHISVSPTFPKRRSAPVPGMSNHQGQPGVLSNNDPWHFSTQSSNPLGNWKQSGIFRPLNTIGMMVAAGKIQDPATDVVQFEWETNAAVRARSQVSLANTSMDSDDTGLMCYSFPDMDFYIWIEDLWVPFPIKDFMDYHDLQFNADTSEYYLIFKKRYLIEYQRPARKLLINLPDRSWRLTRCECI